MKKKEFLNERQIEARYKEVFGVDISVLSKIRNKEKGKTEIYFICPVHGETMQDLSRIFTVGCQLCRRDKNVRENGKFVCGVGFCDMSASGKERRTCYTDWYSMITRCYDIKFQQRRPTYKGCSVCEEWKTFSNFYEWWKRNYVEGYSLDKDLIKKGNKVYSPETCVYIPLEINNLFSKRSKLKYDLPVGVKWDSNNKYYVARMSYHSRQMHLGYFKNPIDAFYAYKEAREAYLQEIAEQYKNVIDIRAYNALMNYKVEITD